MGAKTKTSVLHELITPDGGCRRGRYRRGLAGARRGTKRRLAQRTPNIGEKVLDFCLNDSVWILNKGER